MTPAEAADVLDAIIGSIRASPGQFNVVINVSGAKTESFRGTGVSIFSLDGPRNAQTATAQIRPSLSTTEIGYRQGMQAFDDQIASFLGDLAKISGELRKSCPDRAAIESRIAALRGSWAPDLIADVTGKLASLAFGL